MPEKYHPSPQERDARIRIEDVDPADFIAGVLAIDPTGDVEEKQDEED